MSIGSVPSLHLSAIACTLSFTLHLLLFRCTYFWQSPPFGSSASGDTSFWPSPWAGPTRQYYNRGTSTRFSQRIRAPAAAAPRDRSLEVAKCGNKLESDFCRLRWTVNFYLFNNQLHNSFSFIFSSKIFFRTLIAIRGTFYFKNQKNLSGKLSSDCSLRIQVSNWVHMRFSSMNL